MYTYISNAYILAHTILTFKLWSNSGKLSHLILSSVHRLLNISVMVWSNLITFLSAANVFTSVYCFMYSNVCLPLAFFPRDCSFNNDMKLYFSDEVKWKCYIKAFCKTSRLEVCNWLKHSCFLVVTLICFIYCWCEEVTSCEFCDCQLIVTSHTAFDCQISSCTFAKKCSWIL